MGFVSEALKCPEPSPPRTSFLCPPHPLLCKGRLPLTPEALLNCLPDGRFSNPPKLGSVEHPPCRAVSFPLSLLLIVRSVPKNGTVGQKRVKLPRPWAKPSWKGYLSHVPAINKSRKAVVGTCCHATCLLPGYFPNPEHTQCAYLCCHQLP